MAPTTEHQHTVKECLETLGVDFDDTASNNDNNDDKQKKQKKLTLDEQFKIIKKSFHTMCLKTHPDKGGDPSEFRRIRTSFEVLRELYSSGSIQNFNDTKTKSRAYNRYYDDTYTNFENMPTPSWEFYEEAAEEDIPAYRVERAKTNRSKCKMYDKPMGRCTDDDKGGKIAKGSLRVGSLDEEAGQYSRWTHLECWRVPNRIWKGLPNPDDCDDTVKFENALLAMNDVLFCGFQELDDEDRSLVVEYVMDRENYARNTKPKKKKSKADGSGDGAGAAAAAAAATTTATNSATATSTETAIAPAAAAVSSSAIVKARETFVLPVPGQNGCLPDALKDKRFVLTGVFPEVGGGVGLNMGKDKVKACIESFGGRVTGSVSGKTDMLVLGKEPGFSKVSKGRARNLPLLSLMDLKEGIEGNCIEALSQNRDNVLIKDFSSGYHGNSVARLAAPEDFAAASGTAKAPPPMTAIEAEAVAPADDTQKPAKKKKTKKATSRAKRKENDASAASDINNAKKPRASAPQPTGENAKPPMTNEQYQLQQQLMAPYGMPQYALPPGQYMAPQGMAPQGFQPQSHFQGQEQLLQSMFQYPTMPYAPFFPQYGMPYALPPEQHMAPQGMAPQVFPPQPYFPGQGQQQAQQQQQQQQGFDGLFEGFGQANNDDNAAPDG